MDKEKETEIGVVLASLAQQTLVLAMTVGCALEELALTDSDAARRIENHLRNLVGMQPDGAFGTRAQELLELMYSALGERKPDHE